MGDSKTRTATDVLLDLEQKVELILKYVQNIDHTQKIMLQGIRDKYAQETEETQQKILQQLEALSRKADQPPVVFPAPQSTPTHKAEPQPIPGQLVGYHQLPQTNHFEKMKAAAGIVDEPEPERVAIKAHPEQPRIPSAQDNELEEELVHQGIRRGMRVQTQPSEKVEVSQQVFYSSGKPVVVASVEILDERGLLVSQARTNQTGRWRMRLSPGQYTVHLVKRVAPDSMAQPLELRYNVDITAENSKMELPPPEVG